MYSCRNGERFWLPHGYRENAANRTRERPGIEYWTRRRVKAAYQYQWYVYQWASELCRERGFRYVADVGCGPGIKSARLLGEHVDKVTYIDQESAIAYCRLNHPGAEYIVEDLEEWEVAPSGPFDLVICCDVIEHLNNPVALLRYLSRLGCGAPTYLISTPDRDRLRGPGVLSCPNPAHIREWSADEFVSFLAANGFVALEKRWYPPVKVGLNVLTLRHAARQCLPGRRWRYNFAVLCRFDGDAS
ncbi:class I SAM-dependent methyltransferase [Candidatus Parcubacteria bacterium]|nr:MAG: class I SAM-dependent methyltransferase [Candidatus Parcubacteria bacterium]